MKSLFQTAQKGFSSQNNTLLKASAICSKSLQPTIGCFSLNIGWHPTNWPIDGSPGRWSEGIGMVSP